MIVWSVHYGPRGVVPRPSSPRSERKGWVLHANIPEKEKALALARAKVKAGMTVQVSEMVSGRWRVRYRTKDFTP